MSGCASLSAGIFYREGFWGKVGVVGFFDFRDEQFKSITSLAQ